MLIQLIFLLKLYVLYVKEIIIKKKTPKYFLRMDDSVNIAYARADHKYSRIVL